MKQFNLYWLIAWTLGIAALTWGITYPTVKRVDDRWYASHPVVAVVNPLNPNQTLMALPPVGSIRCADGVTMFYWDEKQAPWDCLKIERAWDVANGITPAAK